MHISVTCWTGTGTRAHRPSVVAGPTPTVGGRTPGPGSYSTGTSERARRARTSAPRVVGSGRACAQPRLHSCPSLLCQRPPLRREAVGAPEPPLPKVSFWGRSLWGVYAVPVCVAAVILRVGSGAEDTGPRFLWDRDVPVGNLGGPRRPAASHGLHVDFQGPLHSELVVRRQWGAPCRPASAC